MAKVKKFIVNPHIISMHINLMRMVTIYKPHIFETDTITFKTKRGCIRLWIHPLYFH